jgi:heptosyltransferase I
MNPRRVGPYRRYQDLLIDAYGDPGEEYAVTMDKRPGRMGRITVRDVMEKVQAWRDRYDSPKR